MNRFFTEEETQLINCRNTLSLTIRKMNNIKNQLKPSILTNSEKKIKSDNTNVVRLKNKGKSNILWEVCELI